MHTLHPIYIYISGTVFWALEVMTTYAESKCSARGLVVRSGSPGGLLNVTHGSSARLRHTDAMKCFVSSRQETSARHGMVLWTFWCRLRTLCYDAHHTLCSHSSYPITWTWCISALEVPALTQLLSQIVHLRAVVAKISSARRVCCRLRLLREIIFFGPGWGGGLSRRG